MGERYERWRTRLRSDRAEQVFGVALVCFLSLCAGVLVVLSWSDVVWSEAGPTMTVYVLGCAAVGTALAVLVPRWPGRFMREARRLSRSQHWGLTAMWIPIGFALSLPFAPTFAETYACERSQGLVVQTSWTETDEDNGTKTGVYSHGGETYDIHVSVEEWLERQVGPAQPPTADNPFYTRTYRVPWAGSGMVCATADSDRNDLVGLGFIGSIAATGAVAAVLGLVRRRRPAMS
jgi:hypothetical protein